MRLQAFLNKGTQTILGQLTAMTSQVTGREQLAHIAESLSYDPPLSKCWVRSLISSARTADWRSGRAAAGNWSGST